MHLTIRKKFHFQIRFADNAFASMGQVILQLNADITALLGMDILFRESLTPDKVANRLSRRVTVNGSGGVYVYID